MAQILEYAGKPRLHLAWVEPTRDPALKRALATHQVVTIHQRARGSKKDFGVVGLEPGRDAQYLIFPKSLRRFEGARIVAIRYPELGQILSLGPVPKAAKRKQAAAPRRKSSAPSNLVRFEPPRPQPQTPRPTAAPPAARASVSADPALRAVARALDALRAGRTQAAQRLLERLLADAAQR